MKYKVEVNKLYLVRVLDEDDNEVASEWAFTENKKEAEKLGRDMIKDIKKSDADFIVRYGGDNSIDRTDYMTEKEATKFYNKLELDTVTTWKELIQEPLDEPEVQRVVKQDSVKVVDLGIGKIAVPE
jgi:hypothetical protein